MKSVMWYLVIIRLTGIALLVLPVLGQLSQVIFLSFSESTIHAECGI